jgi:hypothetical protein
MWKRSCQPGAKRVEPRYVAQKSYGYMHAVTSMPSSRASASVCSEAGMVKVPPVLVMCWTCSEAPVARPMRSSSSRVSALVPGGVSSE